MLSIEDVTRSIDIQHSDTLDVTGAALHPVTGA